MMEIDLLKPLVQIKIFMSVCWILFVALTSDVNFTLLGKVVIVIVTVMFVIGWFKYPYPLDVLVKNANEREREYRDQESSDEDA